jgi:hypothetical protein
LKTAAIGQAFRMKRDPMSTSKQRLLWKGVALGSGTLAALGVRQGAAALWRAELHEEPPTQPAARDVRLRDALVWAASVAVGAAVARVIAERTAAAAWNAATGSAPPMAED